MARCYMVLRIVFVLVLIASFIGIVYISKPITEDELLGDKIRKASKRHQNSDDHEIWMQEIDLLVKQYQTKKEPDLNNPFEPVHDVEFKIENWDFPTEFTPEKTETSVPPVKERRKAHYKQNDHVEMKPSESVNGFLNVHFWGSFCGSRIEDLKRNIHFPYYPSEVSSLTKFYIQRYETGYGQRIFGYLHPPESGEFTFAVSCDDNCEVWLSSSDNPNHMKLIASVGTFKDPANTKIADFQAYPSQISKPILLNKNNKYYVEVLHKQGAYKDHVLLTWLAPTWDHIRTINASYISSYIDVKEQIHDVNDYRYLIPVTKACQGLEDLDVTNSIYYYNRTHNSFTMYDYREDFFKLKSVDMSDFTNLLPRIHYNPTYVLDFMPKRYEGVKLMHESSIYPSDYTELTHMTRYTNCKTPRQTDSHYHYLEGFELRDEDEGYGTDLARDNYNDDYIAVRKKVSLKRLKSKEGSFDLRKMKAKAKHHIGKKGTGKSGSVQFNRNEKIHFNSRKLMAFIDTQTNQNSGPLYNKRDSMKGTDFGYNKEDVKDIMRKMKHAKASLGQGLGLAVNPMQYQYQSRGRSPSDVGPPRRQDSYTKNRVAQVRRPGNPYGSQSYQNDGRYGLYYGGRSRRHRAKKPTVYKTKIFFKDGKLTDSNGQKLNLTVGDKAILIHYYPLFGTATYYLATPTIRRSMWKYKTFLSKCRTEGNLPLFSGVAVGVVNEYMKAVKKKHKSKYKLKRIVNVEENHDVLRGDRYLIEIELSVENEASTRRLSTYIYRDAVKNKLYRPSGFVWNPKATVHVIVPVKNQGRWVQHFIDNMEQVYLETQDVNLNVIIADFNSSDIDIKKSFERSRLKRYNFLNLDGPFERAFGLQAGADLVKNEDDIIFTCDLHLDIPPILIDTIRKHTIKKRLSFAPMVHRLSCGYTPDLPYGLWETEGYGLFSITKHDFDRIGGMNTKEFKTKWGGEDWEFLDRALGHGLEVERLRVPNFFHHYHSRKKMWQASTSSSKSTTIVPQSAYYDSRDSSSNTVVKTTSTTPNPFPE
ncbi:beta-1,4-N-acetylgalactosaminyltransferase 3-like [Clytia hemisphaerica]|uniref:Beta-1,4-N-acetylgalactosaminyltransferase n=1 Tax=Clytia hemisphaerica TaxID=252671 RepID=A0A7M5TWH3_9CNID